MRKRPTGEAGGRRQRVFLVDRHTLMRLAAAGWINRCRSLTVCGMAGRTARAAAEISRLHPDIVVTEIMRPHDFVFIQTLHRRHPRLPILVFTTREQALYGERAAAAGASAYLMKEAGGDKLVQTIRALLERPASPMNGAPKTDSTTRVRGLRGITHTVWTIAQTPQQTAESPSASR